MLPILDVVIGLAFIFLLFSLAVSALNELILSALDKRSDFLAQALGELLADRSELETGRLKKFFSHGLVDSFSRKAKGKPAYLPSKVFVSALLDMICPVPAGEERTMAGVAAKINEIRASGDLLGESLAALAADCGNDLIAFKASLETWFNHAMERTSGWYKRYTQQWLFWLGLVLAIACDVDAIAISKALSSDPKLRDSVVQQAMAYATNQASLYFKGNPPSSRTQESASPGLMQTNQVTASTNSVSSGDVKSQYDSYMRSMADMNATGLPLGWAPSHLSSFAGFGWLLVILGWVLTALAGSLGAPFWFDTLNRFINIRGSGRAPTANPSGSPTRKKS